MRPKFVLLKWPLILVDLNRITSNHPGCILPLLCHISERFQVCVLPPAKSPLISFHFAVVQIAAILPGYQFPLMGVPLFDIVQHASLPFSPITFLFIFIPISSWYCNIARDMLLCFTLIELPHLYSSANDHTYHMGF